MREPDWQHIPFFLAIARQGSLRAAADQLDATHGTVNRHLTALEASYGVALFRRTASGLTITPAGKRLLPVAEDAESLLLRARRQLEGLDAKETGAIRFSLTGTMAYDIVAPLLVNFFERYPGIDVQMRVSDAFDDINRLEADVSLRYTHQVTDDVVARRLFPLALGTYASRSYLDRHLPIAGPGGEGLHWIGWDQIDHHAAWRRDTPFPNADVRHATTDPIMQLQLARRGFGMINSSVYFPTLYPELVEVPGSSPYFDRPLWLLLHTDLRHTRRVRCFVDFLAEELERLRPALQGSLG
ncbi:MAG: LysR family transcriptional regulator [Pseudomonadota bacterium]